MDNYQLFTGNLFDFPWKFKTTMPAHGGQQGSNGPPTMALPLKKHSD
jgi:hypothetical protein